VAHFGGVGGMDAAVKPTWTYSRRPPACATRTEPLKTRTPGYTPCTYGRKPFENLFERIFEFRPIVFSHDLCYRRTFVWRAPMEWNPERDRKQFEGFLVVLSCLLFQCDNDGCSELGSG